LPHEGRQIGSVAANFTFIAIIHATMLAMSRFLPVKLPVLAEKFPSPLVLVRAGAWLIAALVVGWVVSGWFWKIAAPDVAPQTEKAPIPDLQSAARAIALRHLFGRSSSSGDEAGNQSGRVNLSLLGAMTSVPGSAGFAILADGGNPAMAVVEGETFLPGMTLVEILPGKVRVKVGEREEFIEMTKQPSMQRPTSEADSANNSGGPARQSSATRPERPHP